MATYDDVLVALRRIVRTMDFYSKKLARETGLTASQILVLQTVRAMETATIGRIARAMNLSFGTVTVLTERLERRGLLRRQRNALDRRKVDVTLTEDGTRLLDTAPPILQERFREAFEVIDDWEKHFILSALQRIAQMMDAEQVDASPVLDVGKLDRSADGSNGNGNGNDTTGRRPPDSQP